MAEKKHAADHGEEGKTETGTEAAGNEGASQGGANEHAPGDGTGESGPGADTPGARTPAADTGAENGTGEIVPGDVDEEIDPAQKALAISMLVSEILASAEFVEGVRAIVAEQLQNQPAPTFALRHSVEDALRELVEQGVVDAQVLEAAKQRDAERQEAAEKAEADAAEKLARKRAKEAEAAAAKRAEEERRALEEATDSMAKVRKLAAIADDEEREELRSGEAGVVLLRFGDADKFLPDMTAIVVPAEKVIRQHGQAVVDIDVTFAPELQPAKITDAWLFGEDAAIQCEIPAGLTVGGGRSARIPTGSLMF
ncbi:MAG TPA: hypothetical protein VFW22_16225 [Pseudolabrys sp.]|nr:hypothetical protein [Pseudolabrys sp.]